MLFIIENKINLINYENQKQKIFSINLTLKFIYFFYQQIYSDW
jgi:hypothetical protein